MNLYNHKAPIVATVAGNYRLTPESKDSDVRHIVLDFGKVPFPVLEGQSIAVLPPGVLPDGRPHHARQYSVASPRNGERPGYNNLSLTVKRVVGEAGGGRGPVEKDGVCSNYLCDLKKGDSVQVIGPFGTTFLMPNHPGSNLLMICTGTGSAPMRAMTEYRRRKRLAGATGKLMLFFGARTQEELPYFGPLMNLPKDFIDVNFAFSRAPGQAAALRAGRAARPGRRRGRAARRRRHVHLRLRSTRYGGRRRRGVLRAFCQSERSVGASCT